MVNLVTAIPFANIEKISIYINSGRKTMAQIKRELGCDYIINAGLFNMATFRPMNYLVSDGRILSSNGGKFGFSFNGSVACLSYDNNVNYPHHVSGYPCLIKDGEKAFSKTPAGLEGHRGRSAAGITKDALILRAVQDVSGNSDFTLDELYRDMKNRGCIHAINLDGGGSVQCDFYSNTITSSRIVHNFICVWLKKPGSGPVQPKPEPIATKRVSVRTALNIRAGAPNALGINLNRVIGTYRNGEVVPVYEAKAGWWRTDRGWCYGLYLK